MYIYIHPYTYYMYCISMCKLFTKRDFLDIPWSHLWEGPHSRTVVFSQVRGTQGDLRQLYLQCGAPKRDVNV